MPNVIPSRNMRVTGVLRARGFDPSTPMVDRHMPPTCTFLGSEDCCLKPGRGYQPGPLQSPHRGQRGRYGAGPAASCIRPIANGRHLPKFQVGA